MRVCVPMYLSSGDRLSTRPTKHYGTTPILPNRQRRQPHINQSLDARIRIRRPIITGRRDGMA